MFLMSISLEALRLTCIVRAGKPNRIELTATQRIERPLQNNQRARQIPRPRPQLQSLSRWRRRQRQIRHGRWCAGVLLTTTVAPCAQRRWLTVDRPPASRVPSCAKALVAHLPPRVCVWMCTASHAQARRRRADVPLDAGALYLRWGRPLRWLQGKTLVHEIGHFFGLFHTFQGGCGGKGDDVDDTPAERTAYQSSCRDKSNIRDSCPFHPGVDPVTNYMDYSHDACMYMFTKDQAIRMREMIYLYKKQSLKNWLVPAGSRPPTPTPTKEPPPPPPPAKPRSVPAPRRACPRQWPACCARSKAGSTTASVSARSVCRE